MTSFISSEEISVKIIRRKKQACLVEAVNDGVPVRKIVPIDEVYDQHENQARVLAEVFEAGIDYGIRWEDELTSDFTITAVDIANELRKRGIWTASDATDNPNIVMDAIRSTFSRPLQNIQAVIKSKRKSKGGS